MPHWEQRDKLLASARVLALTASGVAVHFHTHVRAHTARVDAVIIEEAGKVKHQGICDYYVRLELCMYVW